MSAFSSRLREGLLILHSIMYLAYSQIYRRYCGSLLGLGWSLMSPMIMIAAYYLAFRIFFRVPIENFAVYLAAGLMPWLFVVNSVIASAKTLTNHRDVLENYTISPLLFLFSTVMAEWLFFLMSYVVAIIFAAISDLTNWTTLLLPVYLMPLFIFTAASGVIIGYASVHFRDIPHLLGVFFALAFWFVPIVYHWSFIPEGYVDIIRYNPLSILITPSQVILHGNALPSLKVFLAGIYLSLIWVAFALYIHRRFRKRIVYYL